MQNPEATTRVSMIAAPLWLILAGGVIVALAVAKSVVDLRAYNTSIDPIGLADEQPAGFLPAYTYQELSSGLLSQAPTLISEPEGVARPAESGEAEAVERGADLAAKESQDIKVPVGDPAPSAVKAQDTSPANEQLSWVPEYLSIPAIGVETDIVAAESRILESQGVNFLQWLAPDQYRTVGWHPTSAELGRPGNTVLNGHNNIKGEVFRNLDQLSKGDLIFVQSGTETFTYQVSLTTILKERHQPIEVKVENARWILPSNDERLTLISCWPYESNSHRVVVVAVPYRSGRGQPME